ncbi:MAG: SDR family NAD(P)-dependent oxidoreductase [Sumerlaeia bacterium]
MPKQLCVIIGFGAGVGAGAAKAFANAGYHLALLSRTPAKTEAVVSEISSTVQAGGQSNSISIETYACNAGSEESLRAALNVVKEQQGEPTVLIYNAVAPTFVMPTQLTAEQLNNDFKVNVAGALVAALTVLPQMQSVKAGSLLFTGGGWAHYPAAIAASPSIGKAGLRSLAFTLAEELQGSGIKVGLLSIMGSVERGTDFDPDEIGKGFLKLHQAPVEGFEVEHFFKGPETV